MRMRRRNNGEPSRSSPLGHRDVGHVGSCQGPSAAVGSWYPSAVDGAYVRSHVEEIAAWRRRGGRHRVAGNTSAPACWVENLVEHDGAVVERAVHSAPRSPSRRRAARESCRTGLPVCFSSSVRAGAAGVGQQHAPAVVPPAASEQHVRAVDARIELPTVRVHARRRVPHLRAGVVDVDVRLVVDDLLVDRLGAADVAVPAEPASVQLDLRLAGRSQERVDLAGPDHVQLRKLPPGVAAGSIWLPRPPSTLVGPITVAHASDADTSASVTAPTPIRALNRLPIEFPPHERCPHNEGTWKPPSCDCTPPGARGAGRAQA